MTRKPRYTADFRKRHKNKKTVIVWKIYTVSDIVRPPYMPTCKICSGHIKSDREIKRAGYDPQDSGLWGQYIHRGIHVYTTREAARRHRAYGRRKVFKCTARMSDLVGVGGYGDHAVFMKIHITKAEFEKGKKGRN